jgi:hypothetical protein
MGTQVIYVQVMDATFWRSNIFTVKHSYMRQTNHKRIKGSQYENLGDV